MDEAIRFDGRIDARRAFERLQRFHAETGYRRHDADDGEDGEDARCQRTVGFLAEQPDATQMAVLFQRKANERRSESSTATVLHMQITECTVGQNEDEFAKMPKLLIVNGAFG